MEKIINGYTEYGQPIWRYKTAEEQLLEELAKQDEINKIKSDEAQAEEIEQERLADNALEHNAEQLAQQ